MTMIDWMNYCWMRDFNYLELQSHTSDLNLEFPPTELEYIEYCKKENLAMESWIYRVTGK